MIGISSYLAGSPIEPEKIVVKSWKIGRQLINPEKLIDSGNVKGIKEQTGSLEVRQFEQSTIFCK